MMRCGVDGVFFMDGVGYGLIFFCGVFFGLECILGGE